MSVNDFLRLLSTYKLGLLIYFIGTPLLTFLLGLAYRPEGTLTSMDYIFSILVYMAGIPGIASASLIFYALLITRRNMLEVNVLIYFLPIISMGAVYYLIGRKTDFKRLPCFGRLSGLMLMIAIVCVIVLFLTGYSFS
ncbi:MAG: hypothetical protein ACMUIP_13905 [bacterium]